MKLKFLWVAVLVERSAERGAGYSYIFVPQYSSYVWTLTKRSIVGLSGCCKLGDDFQVVCKAIQIFETKVSV